MNFVLWSLILLFLVKNHNNNSLVSEPTSVVVVVRVHERHSHGIFSMQSTLVCIAAIHSIHHVSHFLPSRSDGIFTFFSQFPVGGRDRRSQPSYKQIHKHQRTCRPSPFEYCRQLFIVGLFFCGNGWGLQAADSRCKEEKRRKRKEWGENRQGRQRKGLFVNGSI